MNDHFDLRDEMVARLGLAAADATTSHLDDNDLALLEMDALSESEARALRKHVSACENCRRLVADVLRSGEVDQPASQTSML